MNHRATFAVCALYEWPKSARVRCQINVVRGQNSPIKQSGRGYSTPVEYKSDAWETTTLYMQDLNS